MQNAIEELRLAFNSIPVKQLPKREDNQVTTTTQQTMNCNCHMVPMCCQPPMPMICCQPMICPQFQQCQGQSYVVMQTGSNEIKKKKKRKQKKETIIEAETIITKTQRKSTRNTNTVPNINLHGELEKLDQLILSVKQPEQTFKQNEFYIEVPVKEKQKQDNSDMINVLQQIRDKPQRENDHFQIENARLNSELKNTSIQFHELQVRYEELLKQKRKERIVKEIQEKEVIKIVEIPKETIKEVIKPMEIIKEVIKEVQVPFQMPIQQQPVQQKIETIYKDVPRYYDVPRYHDVPVYHNIPVYQEVPVYKDVTVYTDIPVYHDIPKYQDYPQSIIQEPTILDHRQINKAPRYYKNQ